MDNGHNETFNIGSNQKISINKLFNLLNENFNSSFKHFYQSRRSGDILYSCLNNNKAKRLLNWEPSYSFEEGLKETLFNYKDLKGRK